MHIHIISRPNRGPRVEPHLRCVKCSKSTRNKDYIKCKQSTAQGGRLCLPCWEKSDKSTQDCHEWVKAFSNFSCFLCNKHCDQIGECCICDQLMCISCTTRCSLDLFHRTGGYYLCCISCFRDDSIGKSPSSCSRNWCFNCMSHHDIDPSVDLICPLDGTITPKLIRVLRGHEAPPKITPSPSVLSLRKNISRNQIPISKGTSKSCSVTSLGHRSLPARVPSGNYINLLPKSPSIESSQHSLITPTGQEKVAIKSDALKIPKDNSSREIKFHAIEGAASNLQTINFMASMSKQMADISKELKALKNNCFTDNGTQLSIDTSTCKGIQCSDKDIKYANDTVPLSTNELLSSIKKENQIMLTKLNKNVATMASELSKLTISQRQDDSKTNKKSKKPKTNKK